MESRVAIKQARWVNMSEAVSKRESEILSGHKLVSKNAQEPQEQATGYINKCLN